MKKEKEVQSDFFDRFESVCQRQSDVLMIGNLILFTLMSFLLFNMRVSIGGDDSTYIIRAVNFIKDGSYPSFQGPVYPMFLSVFVGLFGIKLGMLKLTSFVLILGSMYGFYRAYKGRVPYSLLFLSMLMLSVSSYFIFFTSQTYSEAIFLALQIPVVILLFKDIESNAFNWKRLLFMALLIVVGYLTRTVGIGTLIAVVIFYLISKDYKKVGVIVGASVVILLAFLVLKNAIWHNGFFDGGQASTLVYKHPYDKTQGLETIGGYLMRFVDNSNLYLSKQLLKMTGLKADDSISYNSLVTILMYGLFLFGAFKSFKNNKYVLFTALYVAIMLGITFIVLQKLWDQYRLIIPFFPFMLLSLYYGLYQLNKVLKIKLFSILLIVGISFATLSAFSDSVKKVDLLTLRKNFKGDKLLGYTDDWVNYLSMAEYVDEKLGEDAYVAVRKPNMAQVYANGRKFYGIYRFDTEDSDELIQLLKEKKVTHIIMASLRKNPRVYNKQTINTIQRYMYHVAKKYPYAYEPIHRIGDQEPAYLFKIHYDRLKTQQEIDAQSKGGEKNK